MVGILTGALVTYFFTRKAIEAEKVNAAAARAEATKQGQLAQDRQTALVAAAGPADAGPVGKRVGVRVTRFLRSQ